MNFALYVSKKLFLTSTEFECGIGLYRPLQTNSFIQINYPAKVCTVSLNRNVFYFQFYAILGVISLYQEFSLDEQVTSAFELRPVSTKIRFVIDMLEMNESHIWYGHVSRLPRGSRLAKNLGWVLKDLHSQKLASFREAVSTVGIDIYHPEIH